MDSWVSELYIGVCSVTCVIRYPLPSSPTPIHHSATIMRYLCQKYKLPDHWYPSDLTRRAKVDEYLDWHHTQLRVGAAYTFFMKVRTPRNIIVFQTVVIPQYFGVTEYLSCSTLIDTLFPELHESFSVHFHYSPVDLDVTVCSFCWLPHFQFVMWIFQPLFFCLVFVCLFVGMF